MLHFQIHDCWGFHYTHFVSSCNHFLVNFNICPRIDSMVLDSDCFIGHLFVQHSIFPILKQLHSTWFLYQSSSYFQFSIQSHQISISDNFHFHIYFYHLTICRTAYNFMDLHLPWIQNIDRFCYAVFDKKIRTYTKQKHSNCEEDFRSRDVKIVLHVNK